MLSAPMREPVDLSQLSVPELGDLIGLIGGTPLVPVELPDLPGRNLWLKLEGANPGASMKDRPALLMIRSLERSGALAPGGRLIDSTSGNFGVSMAWISRALGYRFTAVVDPMLTEENHLRLLALGADVIRVDERDELGSYVLTRIRRAQAVAVQTGACWLNQYASGMNPDAHAGSTGPELLRQAGGSLASVFIAASTGGTLAGVGRYLRSASPRTAVVAVDGEGSSLFGGIPGPRPINGLGSSHPSAFLTPDLYDGVSRIEATAAVARCRQVRDLFGIEVGGSAGASIEAAARWLRLNLDARGLAVAICPDHGANYRSTIFAGALPQLAERAT